MASIENMIKWMMDRQGKVTYSMNSRLGPNSYDCSSAVYFSLVAGGFLSAGSMGNTDTLFGHLEANNWKKVALNSSGYYDVKRGDIFIWGTRGSSGGSAGHTGIFVDSADNIIHCNFGYNGITVNNHDVIWGYNGKPAVTIYRYAGQPTTSGYFTTNPGHVKLKVADGLYASNDLNFTGGKVLGNFPAGTKFQITGIKTTSSGLPRLVTGSGHLLTANKTYVEQTTAGFPNYFNTRPTQVEMVISDGLYAANDRDFQKGAVDGKKYPVGTPFYITGLTYGSNGVPRLITSSGHLLTSNKSYVKTYSGSMFTTYFATNPGKVKLKTADGLYAKNDPDFKNGIVTARYAAGTVFTISGMTQNSNGIPRLITSSGFLLTANKALVEKC